MSSEKNKCRERRFESNYWQFFFFVNDLHYSDETVFTYEISIAIVFSIMISRLVNHFVFFRNWIKKSQML
ncbi:Uncharacterised protein [Bartonella elizabethae]|nr:Uncharacterised protein [Bartonella elizabethae]